MCIVVGARRAGMGSRSGLSWARSWITDSDTNLRNGSGGAGEPGSLITARGVYRYSPRTDDRTKPAGARTTFKFDITDLDTVTDPTTSTDERVVVVGVRGDA